MTEYSGYFDILLVEDDPADAALAQHALKESALKTRVFHVRDGIECLRFLRREGEDFAKATRPHLILLDLNMPRMDGREVLETIKADANLREIPVVVLTTSDFEQDVLRSYDLGANSFVTKPVDIDQFLTVMRSVENYWFNVVTLPR
ncbi:MAG TPA: response regulator [Patescibacteria group bacterium]|nr:response regulator [Patescibacteria group bacterium]